MTFPAKMHLLWPANTQTPPAGFIYDLNNEIFFQDLPPHRKPLITLHNMVRRTEPHKGRHGGP